MDQQLQVFPVAVNNECQFILRMRFSGRVLSALFFCFVLLGQTCFAGQGFTTLDEVQWIGTMRTNLGTFHRERASDCRLSGEELLADDDPNGHWGFASDGIQLSIRFEKAIFFQDAAIVASILIRNVSTNVVPDYVRVSEGMEFLATDERGQTLIRRDIFRPAPSEQDGWLTHVTKSFSLDLRPGTQRKFKMILSDIFDLTAPGKYFVTAKRRFRAQDGKGITELSTGTAMVTVVAGDGTQGNRITSTPPTHPNSPVRTNPAISLPPTNPRNISATASNTTATAESLQPLPFSMSNDTSRERALDALPSLANAVKTDERKNQIHLFLAGLGLLTVGVLIFFLLRSRRS